MTTDNANASNAESPTSSDVLATLDSLLDRTPHDAYICAPLKRSTVAAIAAEIRRLRVQVALQGQDQDRPKPKPPVRPKSHNTRG